MRIVIVEDHQMFREMLLKLCTQDLRHEVVGEAADGPGAVEIVGATLPDLVLLDLHLPGLDGFGVIEAIRLAEPKIKILVLSSHCDEYTVFRAEKLRVQGFVDKNSNSMEALKRALVAIAENRVWFSDAFHRIKAVRRKDPLSFDKVLTERERAVLMLIGVPLTDAEIAGKLGIALETVAKHRFNVLRKLGLKTTVELVRYARKHGFTLTAKPTDDGALLP